MLVIHGGSWQDGNNREFIALNAYLAARDYIVVSINYRLAPKWKFPAGRDDVLSAIAYLKVYGHEFGLDPTRLALSGDRREASSHCSRRIPPANRRSAASSRSTVRRI